MMNASTSFAASKIGATVRLQFNQNFTFDHAIDLIDYFSNLGITHIYSSPILTARQNSTHGYDIVNPTQINSQLGGIDGLRRLVQTLRQHNMGLIIDIVPNHMGVGGHENPWWQHVLEWGRKSPYAFWFDIDWLSADAQINNKVLAPFLGDPYGVVLDKGEITLKFEKVYGRLEAHYACHHFPIALTHYVEILGRSDSEIFEPVLQKLKLIDFTKEFLEIESDILSISDELKSLYETENGQLALDQVLDFYNGNSNESKSAIHELLESQHYRLTWCRNATDEINWRRFFEVSELAGVRVEQEQVFEATHSLIFDLYTEGLIDGLRIDHVDGLAHPQQYCRKLRSHLEALINLRPLNLQQKPYLIAEKILAHNESLVEDWRLEGTTGYDFMDEVNALLHDPDGEKPLTFLWQKITQDNNNFEQHVQNARRQLLSENFVGEFEATASALHKVARLDLQTRDYSLASIKRVLAEILVYFPVYRTYITPPESLSKADQAIFEQLGKRVLRSLSSVDKPIVDIVLNWLSGDLVLKKRDGVSANLSRRAITRFQQLTPPLLAKSVEDTAFYRYGRLLSRNEVGGNPDLFSISVQDFHQKCIQRQKYYPLSMISTATHDHKRGEDARARLAVISELPLKWESVVCDWLLKNTALHQKIHPNDNLDVIYTVPRPDHEYMFYQTLVGHWPYDLSPKDPKALKLYAERLNEWFLKSIREAKHFSNWIQANEDYEAACTKFIFSVLKPQNREFIESVYTFVKFIAYAGTVNSLSMCLLRLTTPGIPDLYQGTELWDFSLVDPDNRRPVNYEMRQKLLNVDEDLFVNLERWEDGSIKQFLIKEILNLRKEKPNLFKNGDYVPLEMTGLGNENFIAFSRNADADSLVIIAPRLMTKMQNDSNHEGKTENFLIDKNILKDLTLHLPSTNKYCFSDLLTKKKFVLIDGKLDLSNILVTLPFAVLMYGPS